MKYKHRHLQQWIDHGFNPIHLFKDYYLLRYYSKNYCKFSFYSLAKIHRDDTYFEVPWSELLWAGNKENGELVCGQLFRLRGHYYICHNTPYTYEECKENGWNAPQVGSWHEVVPNTLRKIGKWKWVNTSSG